MKRVEVRWLDSMIVAGGWYKRGTLPLSDRLLEHKTVGLLVAKHRRYIVVCSSNGRNGGVTACIAIPKVAITRMRRLR